MYGIEGYGVVGQLSTNITSVDNTNLLIQSSVGTVLVYEFINETITWETPVYEKYTGVGITGFAPLSPIGKGFVFRTGNSRYVEFGYEDTNYCSYASILTTFERASMRGTFVLHPSLARYLYIRVRANTSTGPLNYEQSRTEINIDLGAVRTPLAGPPTNPNYYASDIGVARSIIVGRNANRTAISCSASETRDVYQFIGYENSTLPDGYPYRKAWPNSDGGFVPYPPKNGSFYAVDSSAIGNYNSNDMYSILLPPGYEAYIYIRTLGGRRISGCFWYVDFYFSEPFTLVMAGNSNGYDGSTLVLQSSLGTVSTNVNTVFPSGVSAVTYLGTEAVFTNKFLVYSVTATTAVGTETVSTSANIAIYDPYDELLIYSYLNNVNVITNTAIIEGLEIISYVGNISVLADTPTLISLVRPWMAGFDTGAYSGYYYYGSNFSALNWSSVFDAGSAPLTYPNLTWGWYLYDPSAYSSSITKNYPYSINVHSDGSSYNPTGSLQVYANAPVQSTGDFTIEFWIYVDDIGVDFYTLLSMYSYTYDTLFNISIDDSGILKCSFYDFNISEYLFNISSGEVSVDTWTHIAITKSNGVLRTFISGVLETTSTPSSFTINGDEITLGDISPQDPEHVSNLYLDSFRWVSGLALYTSGFTPPAYLSPYFSDVVGLYMVTSVGTVDVPEP
jgi:hypothetical protein